eukprot:jgi/Botrbrau1/8396/Bobra.0237s0017.1
MASEITEGGLQQRNASTVSGDEDLHTRAHEEGEDSDLENSDIRDHHGYQLLGEAQDLSYEDVDEPMSNGWHALPVDSAKFPNSHHGTGSSSTSSDWEDAEELEGGRVSVSAGNAEGATSQSLDAVHTHEINPGGRTTALPDVDAQFSLPQAAPDHGSLGDPGGISVQILTWSPGGDVPGGTLDDASRRYIRRLAAEAAPEVAPLALRGQPGSGALEGPQPHPSVAVGRDGQGSAEVGVAAGGDREISGISEGGPCEQGDGGSEGRSMEGGNESGMEMTAERRTAVLAAMKNFSLPYFPAWAVHVQEEQWVGALRNGSGVLPKLQDGECAGEVGDDVRD